MYTADLNDKQWVLNGREVEHFENAESAKVFAVTTCILQARAFSRIVVGFKKVEHPDETHVIYNLSRHVKVELTEKVT